MTHLKETTREPSPRRGPRVIVSGLLAQYPLGGVTWDYLQYVLGLHRMGVDVYYLEYTGLWPFNPHSGGIAKDCAFNVSYLSSVMEHFGLGDRWAYRFPWDDQWYGMADSYRNEVIATADLLLNVSGVLRDPAHYTGKIRLAYIDSDPVFTQVKLARGQADFRSIVDAHDVHFSFGESPSSIVPATGHEWLPTRQPVVLSEWENRSPARHAFTTVMNWTSYKPVEYEGKLYGQKDIEFRRFLDLPAQVTPSTLEIAVNAGKTSRTPRDLLIHKGWKLVDPNIVCPDWTSYRDYIQGSFAEWSVAKHGYVAGSPGWFSCRSACYLAAARPVVVQNTGIDRVFPVGEGLLVFETVDEAIAAIADVEAHYRRHSLAALDLAHAYFDASKVLASLLDRAMSVAPA